MCFGGREKTDEVGVARSRELDKVIRADEKRLAKEVKLLLLGMHWVFSGGDGGRAGR
jgi:guanine nucleotide-binding protein subunit alpha